MKCSLCGIDDAICEVFMFISGKDTRGITNTQQIASLCNDCVEKLVSGKVILEPPLDAVDWDQLLQ